MPWRGEKNELGLHQGFLRLFSVAEPIITDLIVKAAVFTVHTLMLMGKNALRTAINS